MWLIISPGEEDECGRDSFLCRGLTPAILPVYEGIWDQYMAPGVFNRAELECVQEHLWIRSVFCGILRPFDIAMLPAATA